MITGTEKQLIAVASEMPEDKYEFAPTQGEFRGVRNFAKQLKHAGAVHYLVAASILGEPITADMSDERGPDSAKTKAEVLKYLEDSFVYLRKAASTIDDKNAFEPRACSGRRRTHASASSFWPCRIPPITTVRSHRVLANETASCLLAEGRRRVRQAVTVRDVSVD